MDSIPSLHHRNPQDPSTSLSLSPPSEPPDVGNWFSSYEYKSPDPDSIVNFEDSTFKGCLSETYEERETQEVNCLNIMSGDEGVTVEKLVRASTYFEDDKHNDDLPLANGLDTLSSHSVLLSEPPDIRNWFSSYVYESPMSDTSSLCQDSVSFKDIECEEKSLIFQMKDEHEVRCENVDTGQSLTHNKSSDTNTRLNQLSSKNDGNAEVKKNTSSASTSHLEKILQPCMLQDRAWQHNVNLAKCEETISLNHGNAGCKREQTLTLDIDNNCTRPPDSVYKNYMNEAASKAMIQHENRDSRAIISAQVYSERNSTCAREKENEDVVSMNGFVSTRKSRDGGEKDENGWKKKQEMSLQEDSTRGRDSMAGKKEGDMKRKALGEITNVKICNDMEITGKWKCPRKGKPNVGPPLKQLRLERWVRRN